MSYLIKLIIAVTFLFIPTWIYQEQNDYWNYLREHLKETTNIAAHDSVILSLDPYQASEGYFVLDPQIAIEELKKSLQRNLYLDDNLVPLEGSSIIDPLEIIYFQIIDESNTVFPYLYENSEFNIIKYLHGPAIVVVTQTKQPQLLNVFTQKENILAPSIYQYKLY